jgi:hypothetical protein
MTSIFRSILFYSGVLLIVASSPATGQSLSTSRVLIQLSQEMLDSTGSISLSSLAIKHPEFYTRLIANNVISVDPVFTNRFDKTSAGWILKPRFRSEADPEGLQTLFSLTFLRKSLEKELVSQIKNVAGVLSTMYEQPVVIKAAAVYPNDTEFNFQWHLNDPGNPNADIDAPEAWEIQKGRSDVKLAILDGGIDYRHPDLDPGNRTRIVQGTDVAEGDNDPNDDIANGAGFADHGTTIAGVIGAITNNTDKVSGVMWNCQIIPVKVVQTSYTGEPYGVILAKNRIAFPSTVADGVDYAVNQGANIINMSLGFETLGWLVNELAGWDVLNRALTRAYRNNVVCIAASGNDGNTELHFPACFYGVISVGSSNKSRQKVTSSNYGQYLDVVAPGIDIRTTSRNNTTRTTQGTSLAAPIVSGVGGLIISQARDRGFAVTNDDVEQILKRTADDLEVAGFDERTGHGKVNARKAMELLSQPNVLVHVGSTGGSQEKVLSNVTQVFNAGAFDGLASGAYFCDVYKVRNRINYQTPFCQNPVLWQRDRTTTGLNGASPNSGIPSSTISNASASGFDVETFVYFVKSNTLGQKIDKWYPAETSAVRLEYTAVGVPIGAISGPNTVCGSAVFQAINTVPGSTVSWTSGPGISVTSGPDNTGLVTQTISGTGLNSYLDGVITNSTCGIRSLPRKQFYVGLPPRIASMTRNTPFPANPMCAGGGRWVRFIIPATPGAVDYHWIVRRSGVVLQDFYSTGLSLQLEPEEAGTYVVLAYARNACGESSQFVGNEVQVVTAHPNCRYRVPALSVSPNPVTRGQFTAELKPETASLPAASSNLSSTTAAFSAEPQSIQLPDEFPKEYRLLDPSGTTVRNGTFTGCQLSVSTEGLRVGVYTLVVVIGDQAQRVKVVVQR